MVSVQHSVANTDEDTSFEELLADGLPGTARVELARALAYARERYGNHCLSTGEGVWEHALGMALIAVSLKLDLNARIAALFFALYEFDDKAEEHIEADFGPMTAKLAEGMRRLNRLRMSSRTDAGTPADLRAQTEILRKMVLALAEDIRVVLLRLASRVQTLRHFAATKQCSNLDIARESMDLYAPLANRLGVWQLKWELEDLSFRFLEPDTYKQVARQLDERRVEREAFIAESIEKLKQAIAAIDVKAEVYGRPKHIYSIWNKMRSKNLDFDQVYDVRALRVLVDEVKDCYAVLSLVHELWEPIQKEFDDYILKPKGNNYQSLHTAVRAADGRAMEVQIRTYDMHRHAELGVAAHWRYKEGASGDGAANYNEKIALLRQLLSWRDEVTDASVWEEHTKAAALDDTVYVVTPQGRVIDLVAGSTPIDFAYRLHTDLGHRCRGAKVDGQMVPLDTPLLSGQCVEVVTAKQGGPSRDWLNPQLGYLVTSHARSKVRRWFVQQEEEETAQQGRAIIVRELQRAGMTQANQEDLAGRLGFRDLHSLLLAVGRGDISGRQIHNAVLPELPSTPEPELVVREQRKPGNDDRVLVVGVGRLLTQLARCCKPVPPDSIQGFVTRGRGVSIHRSDCTSFQHIAKQHPERIVPAEWGTQAQQAKERREFFPVDIVLEAHDRSGLLRDISDVFTRDKINVIGVNTVSRSARAYMRFTIEVSGSEPVQRALQQIREVQGVLLAERG
ncbi:MAG: GTP pyrophosphokinase [Candidatus Dactylopiibacterium carminicum]|uniref:GTP pyrophosphokinase n=1 Tax=Candidatus Dactylopiibacterium carminicum TaxID=857335 RepID=A0A272ERE6_9RHOO|nr:bifunctional (p)ppGpp synthetase/guanosine-3',5'-bis(diphosphate) 3'-pyrophosphohydrolase [Candidatus Dactylopiibacterium carminicum]KAF7598792.1 bifunctional (p)ppGpp synthetase/guanosine-3',5'-bis(diphosphate) 3'-pyrophosphohydrolase [Candidatus Dactylopiibacterium carminicum]PAS92681.1 MAG: GTP pyrophosphokinase [Candidatus Dactylopiibacterium carminicum]PAS94724.1 MAG: GTP pyrophosphokinase [Candidatus Dactylopiibacterium carminicum]PAS98813.1 MAG: GTP pyrophosphokinase [Candidatus Dacty